MTIEEQVNQGIKESMKAQDKVRLEAFRNIKKVILEAKTLLKYSSKSIQEIAYYLNFPNQSFFGSYFKRIAGMSPTQYKAQ